MGRRRDSHGFTDSLFPLHIETGLVIMVRRYHLTRLVLGVDGSSSSDGDSQEYTE